MGYTSVKVWFTVGFAGPDIPSLETISRPCIVSPRCSAAATDPLGDYMAFNISALWAEPDQLLRAGHCRRLDGTEDELKLGASKTRRGRTPIRAGAAWLEEPV